MSIIDLINNLKSICNIYYLVPNSDSNNPIDFPFICYVPGQESVYADNKNYLKTNTYTLEYYFKIKNPIAEENLENKLNEMGLTFSKSEDAVIDDYYVIYYYI